ncbi:MAG: hypothetical protein FJW35_10030 [Acidobacteria bacterium]|nr:hypothetical protein [Acidobacteriota bacterium]
MQIYDISPAIHEGIAVWPGDQKFRHRRTMSMGAGDSCNVSSVTMSTHTGSHVDAPLHFDPAARDIAGVSLEPFLGPARVLSIEAESSISAAGLQGHDWGGVERVLFKTRASSLPEDRFEREYPWLSPEAAEFLGGLRLRLVGTDAPSVDAFDSRDLRSHKLLLQRGVAILEGVRLAAVPPGDYELICLPLKFQGLDGSPVRAILRAQHTGLQLR